MFYGYVCVHRTVEQTLIIKQICRRAWHRQNIFQIPFKDIVFIYKKGEKEVDSSQTVYSLVDLTDRSIQFIIYNEIFKFAINYDTINPVIAVIEASSGTPDKRTKMGL